MDCMEFIKGKPDNYYDLAIVDPPYNIVSQQKRGIGSRIDGTGKMNGWNNIKPTQEYFKQLFRISEYQIIWGANNFTLPNTEYFIIWNKEQTVDNFASAEYAWTNIKKPAQIFTFSIHKHNSSKGLKIHPTMKPIQLYKWLLKNYAKTGDKILDTHGGSFSSAIASYYFDCEFDGCELDSDYFRDAIKRVDEQTDQLKLL